MKYLLGIVVVVVCQVICDATPMYSAPEENVPIEKSLKQLDMFVNGKESRK